MSGTAFGAFHSQYSEGGLPIRKADIFDIVAMDMHAGRTSTGDYFGLWAQPIHS